MPDELLEQFDSLLAKPRTGGLSDDEKDFLGRFDWLLAGNRYGTESEQRSMQSLARELFSSGEAGSGFERITKAVEPSLRQVFLTKMVEAADSVQVPERGFLGKLGERFRRGNNVVFENLASHFHDFGIQGTPDDERFFQNVQSIRRQADAAAGESFPENAVLGAAEMAPAMGAGVGISLAGSPLAAMAFWSEQAYPSAKREIEAAGVKNPSTVAVAAGTSAIIQGIIEEKLNRIPGFSESKLGRLFNERIGGAVRQAVVRSVISYGGELAEEGLQGATQSIFTDIARWTDEAAPDRDLYSAVEEATSRALEDMKEAVGPLIVLSAPGAIGAQIQAARPQVPVAPAEAGPAGAANMEGAARPAADQPPVALETLDKASLLTGSGAEKLIGFMPDAAETILSEPVLTTDLLVALGVPLRPEAWSENELAALRDRVAAVWSERTDDMAAVESVAFGPDFPLNAPPEMIANPEQFPPPPEPAAEMGPPAPPTQESPGSVTGKPALLAAETDAGFAALPADARDSIAAAKSKTKLRGIVSSLIRRGVIADEKWNAARYEALAAVAQKGATNAEEAARQTEPAGKEERTVGSQEGGVRVRDDEQGREEVTQRLEGLRVTLPDGRAGVVVRDSGKPRVVVQWPDGQLDFVNRIDVKAEPPAAAAPKPTRKAAAPSEPTASAAVFPSSDTIDVMPYRDLLLLGAQLGVKGAFGKKREHIAEQVKIAIAKASPEQAQSERTAKAVEELKDLAKQIAKKLPGAGTLPLGVDPELLALGVRLAGKAIKVQIYKFADYVSYVVKQIGTNRARRLASLLETSWNHVGQTDKRIDSAAAGDALKYIDAAPKTKDRPGRPDLAERAFSPEGEQDVRAVDAARNAIGEPKRVNINARYRAPASAAAAKDLQNEIAKLVTASKSSNGVLEPDQLAVLNAATAILDFKAQSGTATETERIQRLGLAHLSRRAGTQWAHTGKLLQELKRRARRSGASATKAYIDLVIDALNVAPDRLEARLNDATESGNVKERNRILALLDKYNERIKKSIRKWAGVDLDDPASIGKYVKTEYDAVLLAKMILSYKGSIGGMILEFYRNSILSGFLTIGANVLSNTAFGLFHYAVLRPAASLAGSLSMKKGAPKLADLPYLFAGFMPALARGWANMIASWRTETPWLEHQLGRQDNLDILEGRLPQIPGRVGRGVRFPQRALLATDEFNVTTIANMEVGAAARTIAQDEEGLKGAALGARMRQLTLDTQSEAWKRALDHAHRLTFKKRNAISNLGLGLRRAAENTPGIMNFPVRFAVETSIMFVITPAAILYEGMRQAPLLGSAALPVRFGKAIRSGKPTDWHDAFLALGEQAVWWGILGAIMWWNQDPEQPFITGTTPPNDWSRQPSNQTRFQPMSIRFGNRWFSYSRIEPFATTLAMTVDTVNSLLTSNDPVNVLASVPFKSLAKQLDSKTFLSGIADLMQLAGFGTYEEEPLVRLAKHASKIASNFMPNLLQQPAAALARDFVPERRVNSESPREFLESIATRTVKDMEVFAPWVPDRPRYDLWGRPVEMASVRTSIPYAILVPVPIHSADIFVGDDIINRWNVNHPEDQYRPSVMRRKISVGRGKEVELSDEAYETMTRRAGEYARAYVESRWPAPPQDVTQTDIAVLKRLVEASRNRARKQAAAALRR